MHPLVTGAIIGTAGALYVYRDALLPWLGLGVAPIDEDAQGPGAMLDALVGPIAGLAAEVGIDLSSLTGGGGMTTGEIDRARASLVLGYSKMPLDDLPTIAELIAEAADKPGSYWVGLLGGSDPPLTWGRMLHAMVNLGVIPSGISDMPEIKDYFSQMGVPEPGPGATKMLVGGGVADKPGVV